MGDPPTICNGLRRMPSFPLKTFFAIGLSTLAVASAAAHPTSASSSASTDTLRLVRPTGPYPPRMPPFWYRSGAAPQEYRMELSPSARFRGHFGAVIEHVTGSGQSFGTLAQAIRAAPYRGKRVVLRGWMKTLKADSAQMWLRIDAIDRSLAMDNMDDRAVKGTTAWHLYEIVMDVPANANDIAFGFFLQGKGAMAVDDMTLRIAPDDARLTRFYDLSKETSDRPFRPARHVYDAPYNLDFED